DIHYIIKPRSVLIFFTSILNVFLILKIGFQTLITLQNLMLIFIIPIFISFVLFKFIYLIKSIYRLSFCIIPFVINLFFLFNFIFSSNEVEERYTYTNQKKIIDIDDFQGRTVEQSTLIILEGNKYQKYKGIRMFLDFDKVKYYSKIQYTF